MMYTLLVLFLVMSFFMIYRLRAIQKHDRVLFLMCAVRREIMTILRDRNYGLSRDDYISIRELLEILNHSIHYYNKIKAKVFNFREFLKFLKQYESDSIRAKNIAISENPEVITLYKRLQYAILVGFFTYTPFLKSELVFNAVIYAFKAIAARLWKERIREYVDIMYQIKRQSIIFNIPSKLSHPLEQLDSI